MAPTACSNGKTNGRRTQGPNRRSPHGKAITSASSSNTADPPSKHLSNTSRPRRSAAAIQTPRNSSSSAPGSNRKRFIETEKQKDMLNKAWDISPNPPIVAIIYLAHSTRLHDQPMGFNKVDAFFQGRRVAKTKHATKTGNNLEIERLHQGEKRVKKVTDNMIKNYKGDREGFIYKYEAGMIDENTGEELYEPCLKQDTWIRKYKAANPALLDNVASKEFQDKPAESAFNRRGTFNIVHDQNQGWGKPCAEEKLEDLNNPLERDSANRYLDGDVSPPSDEKRVYLSALGGGKEEVMF